ncbi:MAG TPA: hypothetical protein ENI34_07610 [candidate division WOR-3 bacterium]|uniref:Uncharacterized protein n=1 Tax=candidate division WOR-3 bacterium TaxID=2052148 RepID=A0A9C9EN25_UNCW3|nr:hypothetical protein [candidate division WOR-3 bacterium]
MSAELIEVIFVIPLFHSGQHLSLPSFSVILSEAKNLYQSLVIEILQSSASGRLLQNDKRAGGGMIKKWRGVRN